MNIPSAYDLFSNIVNDLMTMGYSPIELEMDRGFFSIGNVQMMVERNMGFTLPIPARLNISKLLLWRASEILTPHSPRIMWPGPW